MEARPVEVAGVEDESRIMYVDLSRRMVKSPCTRWKGALRSPRSRGAVAPGVDRSVAELCELVQGCGGRSHGSGVDDRPEFCADLADTRPVSIVRSTAILVVAVGLAANGVSMVTCLVVIALAPAHCIVVGERLGSEGR